MPFLDNMENIIFSVVTFMVHVLEIMGALIIIWGACRSFFSLFSMHKTDVRLELAQFMALGLEFKLGGEILRTVIVRDLKEIAVVGAIILLRTVLNFLIHWEIKHIKHDDEVTFGTFPERLSKVIKLSRRKGKDKGKQDEQPTAETIDTQAK